MNKRALLPLLMGLLLLPLGCADPTGPPQVLQPNELCSDHSAHDIATFEDRNSITDVSPLSGLTSLGWLDLH